LNQALKQRLVGTLVLGCLAIIFIPLILDGEGLTPAAIETTIPPAPDLSYQNLPQPERPLIEADSLAADTGLVGDDMEDALDSTLESALDSEPDGEAADAPEPETAALPTAEPAPESDAAAPATADIPLPVPADRVESGASTADTTPQRGADGLPAGWTVRLGVFGNLANADKLRACLIASGFQAYSRQQQGDTGTLTRVFVGPVATRAEATALGNQLKGKCDLTENGIPVQYTLQ
jgi:DedD protein